MWHKGGTKICSWKTQRKKHRPRILGGKSTNIIQIHECIKQIYEMVELFEEEANGVRQRVSDTHNTE